MGIFLSRSPGNGFLLLSGPVQIKLIEKTFSSRDFDLNKSSLIKTQNTYIDTVSQQFFKNKTG